MISALAEAGAVLERPDYLDAARGGGRLRAARRCATTRAGCCAPGRTARAKLNAYLEDHAFLLEALLTLYEASFEPRWFAEARALADTMIERFADDEQRRLLRDLVRPRAARGPPQGPRGPPDPVRQRERRATACCGWPRSPASTPTRSGRVACCGCSTSWPPSTRRRSATCSRRSTSTSRRCKEVALVGDDAAPARAGGARRVPAAPGAGRRRRPTACRCSQGRAPRRRPGGRLRVRALRLPGAGHRARGARAAARVEARRCRRSRGFSPPRQGWARRRRRRSSARTLRAVVARLSSWGPRPAASASGGARAPPDRAQRSRAPACASPIQAFEVPGRGRSRNVIGVLDGPPQLPAHRHGTRGQRPPGAPGANDNASGLGRDRRAGGPAARDRPGAATSGSWPPAPRSASTPARPTTSARWRWPAGPVRAAASAGSSGRCRSTRWAATGPSGCARPSTGPRRRVEGALLAPRGEPGVPVQLGARREHAATPTTASSSCSGCPACQARGGRRRRALPPQRLRPCRSGSIPSRCARPGASAPRPCRSR